MRLRLVTAGTAVAVAALWSAAPASAHQAAVPSPAADPDLPGPMEGYFGLSGFDPEPWYP